MFSTSFKLVAGTTVALSLAACGAAGGPGGSNEKVSDGKIVLGVLNDQSGPYKDLSGPNSVEAVKMAVDDWKAAHKDDAVSTDVEVITADFSTKPDVANTKAQEMYDRQKADLVLDVPNSAAALAVATQAKNKKRVYINVGAGTSALTGASCNKYTFHWPYDTWMLSNGAAKSVTDSGGKNWAILYPDYEFGQASDKLYTGAVEAAGGKVVAHIPTPFPNENFATFITKAKQTNPDVIASMHGGGDLANFFKQYQQSGVSDKIKVVGGVVFLSDIKSIGAQTLKGMQFTDSWYWNMDKDARAWADRFQEKVGTRPTAINAGNYSAAYQYLEAVQEAGTDKSDDVVAKLEGKKINDIYLRNGEIRAKDHRVIHDVYLAEVKDPKDAEVEGDYEKIVNTIPAEKAFRPLEQSECSM